METLIRLITYQTQHPTANDQHLAQGVGITQRYLRQCKSEVNLLKRHLCSPTLDAGQRRFLISLLSGHDPYQQQISHLLQQGTPSTVGRLRAAAPGESASPSRLDIGEIVSAENGATGRLSPVFEFWLGHLCYDPLVWVNRNGAISARLATSVEPVEDFSHWRISLRTDLRWSDGRPIGPEDVKKTLSETFLGAVIDQILTDGRASVFLQFSRPQPILPLFLRSVPIRPAHSPEPYRVTSGGYQLKRFRPGAKVIHLARHRDYYRTPFHGPSPLTLKRFSRPANAIKAALSQRIDFLPLRSLQPLYRLQREASPQQWPFWGESYYLLFLNRGRGPLREETTCRLLARAIDFHAITRYLHVGQQLGSVEIQSPCPCSLDISVVYSPETKEPAFLAQIVGKSINTSQIHPAHYPDLKTSADLFLTQIYFGPGYSRLSRYFRSDGRVNPFGYANPAVDQLLWELDQTGNLAQRHSLGQKVLSLVQADFAVILLSPCFEYFLSSLDVQFDENLTNFLYLAQNMSDMVVRRNTG